MHVFFCVGTLLSVSNQDNRSRFGGAGKKTHKTQKTLDEPGMRGEMLGSKSRDKRGRVPRPGCDLNTWVEGYLYALLKLVLGESTVGMNRHGIPYQASEGMLGVIPCLSNRSHAIRKTQVTHSVASRAAVAQWRCPAATKGHR